MKKKDCIISTNQIVLYWKWVLGLEAEKTFLNCFEAGRKILWGRGNLILLFCNQK